MANYRFTAKRKRSPTSKSPKKPDNAPKRRKPSPVPDAVQLDPDGDAVVVLGNGKKFLISSKVMSMTSSVFRIMFGPDYKEGGQLLKGEIPVVNLDEDNPAAMTMILGILHHKVPDVSKVCNDHKFRLQLAICCDKYDFGEALSYWISQWLAQYRHVTRRKAFDAMKSRGRTAEDCGLILATTYLFRDPILPKLAVKVAAMMKDDWMDVWETQGILKILPEKFVEELIKTVNTTLDQMDIVLQASDMRMASPNLVCTLRKEGQADQVVKCRDSFHQALGASECVEMPAVVPLSFATGSLAEIQTRLSSALIQTAENHNSLCVDKIYCHLRQELARAAEEVGTVLRGMPEVKLGITWVD